ncbi:MAG: PRC-barrel domain-containing protein [Geminicoccaceae bacterium]
MRKTLTGAALAALLAGSPALVHAQTDNAEPDSNQEDRSVQPAQNDAGGEGPGSTDATAADASGAGGLSGDIDMESGDIVLANQLIGSAVYNDTDESIGSVNDLILDMKGSVEGVVVGVGGFLGLAEKDVAIDVNNLTTSTADTGDVRLVVDATKEDLEAAPVFETEQ